MTDTPQGNWEGFRPAYVIRLGPQAISLFDGCMDTLVGIGYTSGEAAVIMRYEFPVLWEHLDKSDSASDGGQDPAQS